MCAVCCGCHIVLPAFVDECLRAMQVVDETPFLLRDSASEVWHSAVSS